MTNLDERLYKRDPILANLMAKAGQDWHPELNPLTCVDIDIDTNIELTVNYHYVRWGDMCLLRQRWHVKKGIWETGFWMENLPEQVKMNLKGKALDIVITVPGASEWIIDEILDSQANEIGLQLRRISK